MWRIYNKNNSRAKLDANGCKVTEKATRTEKLYGTVCYKSTKSRTLESSASTKTKWSSYNDRDLLDNGWTYTGRKKRK